ncbi:hypothetical protein V8C37DRAFT_380505 [Trichoderma ceciliae]
MTGRPRLLQLCLAVSFLFKDTDACAILYELEKGSPETQQLGPSFPPFSIFFPFLSFRCLYSAGVNSKTDAWLMALFLGGAGGAITGFILLLAVL